MDMHDHDRAQKR